MKNFRSEVWRNIPDSNGIYQSSTEGRIRSLDHNYKPKGYKVFYISKKKGKIVKPYRNKLGYLSVSLCEDGKRKTHYVHDLVAETFPEICGERLPGYEISHLDENPTNNKAENLRWVSHTDNINWGSRNLKAGLAQRNRKDCSKTIVQYTLDGKIVKEYPSGMEANRQTGINCANIFKCCKHSSGYKTAGGYKWEYKNI